MQIIKAPTGRHRLGWVVHEPAVSCQSLPDLHVTMPQPTLAGLSTVAAVYCVQNFYG